MAEYVKVHLEHNDIVFECTIIFRHLWNDVHSVVWLFHGGFDGGFIVVFFFGIHCTLNVQCCRVDSCHWVNGLEVSEMKFRADQLFRFDSLLFPN